MGVKYHCDICPNELKLDFYIVAIYKDSVTSTTKTNNFSELLKFNKNISDSTKTYMICKECHNVWQHLLNMRVLEIAKLKKDFVGYMKNNLGENEEDINGNKR